MSKKNERTKKLYIIDGVKVLFTQNKHGFWEAEICNSLAGDLFFLGEWLVRGEVEFLKALDTVRVAIPLMRLGYIVIHSDAEGRVCFLPLNIPEIEEKLIDAERGEQWKGTPVPKPGFLSNRLSRKDPQDAAAIRALIAETEAEFDWSSATQIAAYSEGEAVAKLQKYKP